jgi:hypothetical protein
MAAKKWEGQNCLAPPVITEKIVKWENLGVGLAKLLSAQESQSRQA